MSGSKNLQTFLAAWDFDLYWKFKKTKKIFLNPNNKSINEITTIF